MASRLLHYALGVIHRHLKNHSKRHKGNQYTPLVIPILFYAGRESPYPYSMNWFDTFENPQLARQLYSGDFPLVDITVIPDNEIGQHRRVAIMEFLLKNIARRRNLESITDALAGLLADQLQAGYIIAEDVRNALTYAIQTGDASDHHNFMHTLAKRLPQHEDEIMTIAQKLRKEGFEQGIEQGIEQGFELGRKESMEAVARNLIKLGINLENVQKATGLSVSELERILPAHNSGIK